MNYETNEPDEQDDATDPRPCRRDGWLDDLLTEVEGDPLLEFGMEAMARLSSRS